MDGNNLNSTTTQSNAKLGNKCYITIIICLVIIILFSAFYIMYDKGIIFNKDNNTSKNTLNNKKINSNSNSNDSINTLDSNDLDTGIHVYRNGKIADESILKQIYGKYTEYDGTNTKKDGYIILDDLSKSEIYDPGMLMTFKSTDIVSIRYYLFNNWRHLENENFVDTFVVEFSVKDGENIRNLNYLGYLGNDKYILDQLVPSGTTSFIED